MSVSMTSSPSLSTDLNTSGINDSSFFGRDPFSLALTKRQTYKDRRKNYRIEKKKVADELMSTLKDPTVVVMTDWLKVRSTLKQWNKFWCELRPGLLLLHKSANTEKSGAWVGTIIINVCEVIERPSKKNGFCFKLFHPLEHPIWAPKGPHGESFASIMFPLPMSYVIFRAPSEAAGKKWMEAIELSLQCSTLLLRGQSHRESVPTTPAALTSMPEICPTFPDPLTTGMSHNLNESEIEKHFGDHDLDDEIHTDHGGDSQDHHSSDESDSDEQTHRDMNDIDSYNTKVCETHYAFDGAIEEFGIAGDAGQTEEIADENKSLIWILLKQVRPGMDLSKVVLPTFILEPRSFLDKLTDYYYHSDIISKAVIEDDPLLRMKLIVKWYLSGFYKKPKGLKKPYNPILGETFRCYWSHPDTDSRTFYIAEQVSHHPPISAFYVTNRKDGFCISGSILAKSKFYGNSISAILEGTARLKLLSRGEDYFVTFPYAHCKGILLGTLALELGGKVNIRCEKTGYNTELEFKLKPFLGSSDMCNYVNGRIRLGNETLGTIEGHWDSDIFYKDKRIGESELFWSPTPIIKQSRLKRSLVPLSHQKEFESERLWLKVTQAIQRQDQIEATVQKSILEEEQRNAAKDRLSKMEKWIPKLFVFDAHNSDWNYIPADVRPWDPRTDVKQYEFDYVIQTITRHRTPNIGVVSANSVNVEQNKLSLDVPMRSPKKHFRKYQRSGSCASEESSSVGLDGHESSESEGLTPNDIPNESNVKSLKKLFESIDEFHKQTNIQLNTLHNNMNILLETQTKLYRQSCSGRNRSADTHSPLAGRRSLSDLSIIVVIIVTQLVFNWLLK
ncbi:oxysterol-binding protein-related protein 8-like [Oppia nitens]|uniref:oxysterol-binding protein-related protein 8-like n=1 Tax=Oppia nitens TaxID=1686743 RepID=UPI0023D9FC6E|nr:oxysterol-binding protein-related protein 8-like [Oppia nitens]